MVAGDERRRSQSADSKRRVSKSRKHEAARNKTGASETETGEDRVQTDDHASEAEIAGGQASERATAMQARQRRR